MAIRYRVARQTVRFCKQTYRKGEFMPESFSERDLYRILYPSRLEKVEVPDKVEAVSVSDKASEQVETAKSILSGSNQAEKTPAAPKKSTGTPLSSQTSYKK